MKEAEKASHTPEPWPDFESVAMKSKVCDMEVVELGKENYNRARACVNACAGVTDGDLQQIADAGGWQAISEQWKQQRDELLAALEDAQKQLNSLIGFGGGVEGFDEFEDLIAKHRGQQ